MKPKSAMYTNADNIDPNFFVYPEHTTEFLQQVAQAKKDYDIPEITPKGLAKLFAFGKNKGVIIDVRTAHEFLNGPRLPGAYNLSLDTLPNSIAPLFKNLKLNKKTPIIVYCRGGYRSLPAAAKFKAAGYENVRTLKLGARGYVKYIDQLLQ